MENLLNELTAFRKQLAVLENRNIALKTQLAHILQYHFDRSLLDRLEYFHTAFLQLDTRFDALKSELALHQAWLSDPDMNTINYDNIRAHQLHIWGKLNTMEFTTSLSCCCQTHNISFHTHSYTLNALIKYFK
jgi:hypothetical protein